MGGTIRENLSLLGKTVIPTIIFLVILGGIFMVGGVFGDRSGHIISKPELITPDSLSGGLGYVVKDSGEKEAYITARVFGASNGCPGVSNIKFKSTQTDRSLHANIKGFYYTASSGMGACSMAVQFANLKIPFNPEAIDEITLELKGKSNRYKVITLENHYVLEPIKVSNVFVYPPNDGYLSLIHISEPTRPY